MDHESNDLPVSFQVPQEEQRQLAKCISRQIIQTVPFQASEDTLTKGILTLLPFGDEAVSFCEQLSEKFNELNVSISCQIIHDTNEWHQDVLHLVTVTSGKITEHELWRLTQVLQSIRALKTHQANESYQSWHWTSISQMSGDFGLSAPIAFDEASQQAIHGITKSAHHEWADATCVCIDIPPQNELDDAHWQWLCHLLLMDTQRQTLAKEIVLPRDISQDVQMLSLMHQGIDELATLDEPRLSKEDLVVVTGGARGVTSEVALKLAEAYQCELVLLGRSKLPSLEQLPAEVLSSDRTELAIKQSLIQHSTEKFTPRELMAEAKRICAALEIHETLDRIRSAGSSVHYLSCDVSDPQNVKQSLKDIQAITGKDISGFIHGAGVLADRLIVDKTHEQLNRVYGTKIKGLNHLLKAIDPGKLKVAVLFASSTARFGRKGQMDYAAANEVLNKSAQSLAMQYPNCKVLSINWGPWDGGMVTPQLKQLFASEGVGVIPLHEGARYLIHELQSASSNPVEITIIGRTEEDQLRQEHDREMTAKYTFKVSPKTLPSLSDHVLGGQAVVPAANMICWILEASQARTITHFKVLKGITFETAKKEVSLKLQKSGEPWVLSGQHPHASACTSTTLSQKTKPASRIQFEKKWPGAQSRSAVYQPGILFHGQSLQGIRKVTHLDAVGIGIIAAPKYWEKTHMRLNGDTPEDSLALFLDCAFQAAILWCQAQKDMGSLPTGFAALEIHQRFPTFTKAMVEINLKVTRVKAHEVTMDIEFINSDKTLLATINDYTCVMNQTLRKSFSQNQFAIQP